MLLVPMYKDYNIIMKSLIFSFASKVQLSEH